MTRMSIKHPRRKGQGGGIDFNIPAGNTLVGFVTRDEVKHAVGSKLDF